MPAFSVNYGIAYKQACEDLKLKDPFVVAGSADVLYEATSPGNGRFIVPYFGKDYFVEFPDVKVHEAASGAEPSALIRVIILHYLVRADGKLLSGEWINFRQLPSGLMYEQAFRAQCVEPIARVYGYDLNGFLAAGDAIGGERARMGDASFLFRVFPRVLVACLLWLGDDELPPAADILFDAAVPHYLSIEDVDGVGRDLSARLVGYKLQGGRG